MSAAACHHCGVTAEEWAKQGRELRPYGPGGTWICFPCMKATPEREATAHGAYGALLDSAAAITTTGVIAIGDATGPRPFDPKEAS